VVIMNHISAMTTHQKINYSILSAHKMQKFKIRAYAVDFYDVEVEADSLEHAQEIFTQKQDAGDFEFEETLFLEGDDGFGVVEEFVSGE
jgi:hypothetical protein